MNKTDFCPWNRKLLNKNFHGGLQRPPRKRCAKVHGPRGSVPEESDKEAISNPNQKTT